MDREFCHIYQQEPIEEKSILEDYPNYISELNKKLEETIDEFNINLLERLNIQARSDMVYSLKDLVIIDMGGEYNGEGDD